MVLLITTNNGVRLGIEFITSNKVKLKIAREVLKEYKLSIEQRQFKFREIQSIDVKEVALDKGRQVIQITNKKFIIDDSGLYIRALNKFPGALLKTVYKSLGDDRLVRLMENEKDRRATFVNALAYGDPKTKKLKIFLTEINGEIAAKPRGSRQLGWAVERIFVPNGYDKTLAQLNGGEWEIFWGEFKSKMHYAKLGRWIKLHASK